MQVRYLLPASVELFKHVDFYESQAPRLGEEFLDEVEYSLDLLASYPKLGAPHLEGTRRVVLSRFPVDLVYLLEDDAIIMVAFASHHRAPGYWRDRS